LLFNVIIFNIADKEAADRETTSRTHQRMPWSVEGVSAGGNQQRRKWLCLIQFDFRLNEHLF